MSSKVLFICSDTSAFSYECKYRLKDRWKVYSSEECENLTDDEKKQKLASSNLVIVNIVHNKNDLKLLNLNEYKKIAVLRNHESRSVGWASNAFLKCDAVCKYKDQELLTDFKDVDNLIKNLQAIEIDVDGDWKYWAKKGLSHLLFCITLAK